MDEKRTVSRRTFLKAAGAAGIAASTTFPFRNLNQAWAFGEHPQEKAAYMVTKKIPQVCNHE